MRVAMLTGSFPPEICGVGDYTWNLVRGLRDAGVEVDSLVERTWREADLFRALRSARKGSGQILHIQYPSVGFGVSVGPQIISVLRPTVVTLHEFSRVRMLRRAAIAPFCWRSYVIFTSEFERRNAISRLPVLETRSEVIPIGTNILAPHGEHRRRMSDIVYFGLIVPGKGLEDVLHLASIIKARGLPLRVRVIGERVKRVRRFMAYAEDMQRRSADLPVEWILGSSQAAVSDLLAEAGIGYLPFPDGASERRGSLKAMLAAGVACITRDGEQLTDELRRAVVICGTPGDALEQMLQWNRNQSAVRDLSEKALKFAKSYDWDYIVRRHIEMYRRLLNGSPTDAK